MFRSVRGRAVIINNKYFVRSRARPGSEHDRDNLRQLFTALHFNVEVYENKTAQVMIFLSLSLVLTVLQSKFQRVLTGRVLASVG